MSETKRHTFEQIIVAQAESGADMSMCVCVLTCGAGNVTILSSCAKMCFHHTHLLEQCNDVVHAVVYLSYCRYDTSPRRYLNWGTME